MSTNLVVKLGIQIIASSLTMTLGIWGRNCKVTAVEIPQYKENVSNKITQNIQNTAIIDWDAINQWLITDNLDHKKQKTITDCMEKQKFLINKAEIKLTIKSKISILGMTEFLPQDKIFNFFCFIFRKNLKK
jgi:hypothetical protein